MYMPLLMEFSYTEHTFGLWRVIKPKDKFIETGRLENTLVQLVREVSVETLKNILENNIS